MGQVFTIEALANQTGFDRRTVAAALRSVAPDGQSHGRPAWYLRTAFEALQTRQTAAVRGRDRDEEELLRLVTTIERWLVHARKIENIEERREFLIEIGPLVGRMDRKLTALDGADIGAKIIHDYILCDTVSQFLGLMRWRLPQTDPDDLAEGECQGA